MKKYLVKSSKLKHIDVGAETVKEAVSFAKYSYCSKVFSIKVKFVPESCPCFSGIGIKQR